MFQSVQAQLMALLLALFASTACSAKRHMPVDTRAEVTRLERSVHREVNRVRVDLGLTKLRFDGSLASIARKHSKDMARRNYFSHFSPTGESFEERYNAGRYWCSIRIDAESYSVGAENLYLGHRAGAYLERADGHREEVQLLNVETIAKRIVADWMNSPEHREILIRPIWQNEGIGVYIDSDGQIYVTQNFC